MSYYSYSLQGRATIDSDCTADCTATIIDAAAIARIRSLIVDDVMLARTTEIFSALADSTRCRILEALSHEELCVCDLASICDISQSGVSHQLKLLRDRGLVAYRRDGNRAVYRLADEHVRTMLAQGFEHAAEAREER